MINAEQIISRCLKLKKKSYSAHYAWNLLGNVVLGLTVVILSLERPSFAYEGDWPHRAEPIYCLGLVLSLGMWRMEVIGLTTEYGMISFDWVTTTEVLPRR